MNPFTKVVVVLVFIAVVAQYLTNRLNMLSCSVPLFPFIYYQVHAKNFQKRLPAKGQMVLHMVLWVMNFHTVGAQL